MKKLCLLAAVTAFAMLGLACSEDNSFLCDASTFKASCINSEFAEICTNGEVARWQCSPGQTCENGTCVKATK